MILEEIDEVPPRGPGSLISHLIQAVAIQVSYAICRKRRTARLILTESTYYRNSLLVLISCLHIIEAR
jgi:hypothetical protein